MTQNNSDYKIIKMNAAHVVAVAGLEKQCFSTPWSLRSITSELSNPLSYWIVAVNGENEVLGYAGSQAVLDEADVMNVAVAPAARNQGLASRLMTALMVALADRGVHRLSLEVRASNYAAISMYQKLGFLQAGIRPGYYTDPKEDALILCAVLPSAEGSEEMLF